MVLFLFVIVRVVISTSLFFRFAMLLLRTVCSVFCVAFNVCLVCLFLIVNRVFSVRVFDLLLYCLLTHPVV